MAIIARKYEQKQLENFFGSNVAGFAAVYGRRRVGKTHLIREFFNKKRCIFFRSSGILNGTLKKQLGKFKQEIEDTFYKKYKGTKLSPFSSWHDALEALKDAINLFAGKQKVVLFLDEIPWMATPKSGLLEALDYYWNRHWSEDGRVKLIICGSAASWIIDNVLHNTGGLHNRVTLRLRIEPFNMADTKAYLKYKKIHYNNDQILTLYMCIGGIPFYLNFIEKGLSAIQNINNICFNKKGALHDEFDLLFVSLFKKHEIHNDIISFIARKREGVSRSEIESHFNYKGGRLTARLKELEEAAFITAYMPWKKERGLYYKIIDEYSLFYLTWIAPRAENRISSNIDDRYWEVLSSKHAWIAWSGYAFESICFKHVNQIKAALCIPDGSEVSAWRYTTDMGEVSSGAQIDLIFDRPDKIINICDIKYCTAPYVVTKKYASHILSREKIYCSVTGTTKQIFHSLVVSGGLKKSMYSEEIIASYAVLDDLFKD